jgi:hypothetical protein
MSSSVAVEIAMPDGWEDFKLPEGLHRSLQDLLDRQDRELPLTDTERAEAESLVDIAEWLSLLRLQARHIAVDAAQQ